MLAARSRRAFTAEHAEIAEDAKVIREASRQLFDVEVEE
jgi:hypothetical protein